MSSAEQGDDDEVRASCGGAKEDAQTTKCNSGHFQEFCRYEEEKNEKDNWLKYEMTHCLRLLLQRSAILASVQSAVCLCRLMKRKEQASFRSKM